MYMYVNANTGHRIDAILDKFARQSNRKRSISLEFVFVRKCFPYLPLYIYIHIHTHNTKCFSS